MSLYLDSFEWLVVEVRNGTPTEDGSPVGIVGGANCKFDATIFANAMNIVAQANGLVVTYTICKRKDTLFRPEMN